MRVTGEAPANLSPVPPVKEQLPATRDDAVEQAIANNATLQSAGADIQAAQAQHEASKSGYYPRVDLELSSTWSEDVQGYDGEEDYLTAMLNLRWNLFNGGRDRARDRQTAELVNEAKEVRNRTHRQVEESVRLAWAAYQASESQADFLRQHVEESEKTRDAYAKQFKLGQRSLLDLLNTENELFEARRNELSNTYDGLFAQFRLLRGMSVLTDVLGLTVPEAAKTL
jgi:adhesin transport system outer membrane protein